MTNRVDGFVTIDEATAGALHVVANDPAKWRKIVGGFDLSAEQMAAVRAPAHSPSLIVAGAGSGKTTVMAARVVWLVGNEGISPAEIIGLTFTRKAAAQLSAKIRRALRLLATEAGIEDFENLFGEPHVSTYDAFAGQLIDEFGVFNGIESEIRLETDAARYLRALSVARSTTKRYENLNWLDIETQILDLDSELNNHLVSIDKLRIQIADLIHKYENERPDYYLDVEQAFPKNKTKRDKFIDFADNSIKHARARLELLDLVEQYREAKRRDGVAEYSDIMAWGAQLAQNSTEVQNAMRSRYRIVLLDEYQDTAGSQGLLLQGLFADGRAVTAVGDPMQNIYGWRGAAAGTLERFITDFPKKDGSPADVFNLRTARRSDRLILDLANTVVKQLLDQDNLVKKLEPRADAGEGVVSVSLYDSESKELAALVSRIKTLNDLGTEYRDIGILLRGWNASVSIASALGRAGIPVEIVGLPGLLNQPEILDVLSLLEAAVLPDSNRSIIRLLTNPRWKVGPRDLAMLADRAAYFARKSEHVEIKDLRELFYGAIDRSDSTDLPSLLDAIGSPGDFNPYTENALKAFAELNDLVKQMRKHRNEPILDQISKAVILLGLDIELSILDHGDQGFSNLSALNSAASEYIAGAAVPSITGFLNYLQVAKKNERALRIPTPSASDSVKLTTIHSAKGLEWKIVFLPSMVGRVFPSQAGSEHWFQKAETLPPEARLDRKEADFIPDLSVVDVENHRERYTAMFNAEERRLLYVAITRAAKELHISGHWWSEEGKKRDLSKYLEEIKVWAEPLSDKVKVEWFAKEVAKDLKPEPLAIPWPVPTAVIPEQVALAQMVKSAPPKQTHPEFSEIDKQIELLEKRARDIAAGVIKVPLPNSVATTTLIKIKTDPNGFAEQRYRPMPIKPVAQARRGTRFHEWVANYFASAQLIEPEAYLRTVDEDADDDLVLFKNNFHSSDFANLIPVAVEVELQTSLPGHLVKAQIDAVFPDGSGYWVVDWKTNENETADPLQLAIYRLAWAEHKGVPVDAVRAGFFYAATGRYVEFPDLPDRAGIEERLAITLKS